MIYDDIFFYSKFHSGPVSCLCSEIGECDYTGDNEVDVLPNIFQVKNIEAAGRKEFYFIFIRKRTARNIVPPILSVATTLGKLIECRK